MTFALLNELVNSGEHVRYLQSAYQKESEYESIMKKVLLVIIDALASRVMDDALEDGRLPTIQRLLEKGAWRSDSTAIFPSITPAATSSLITGCYPREHGISGAYWYEEDSKTVVFFGYSMWAILQEGLGTFLQDFLVRLNEEYLSTETIYQQAEAHGLTAANLNYLIFHGDKAHEIDLPFMLNIMPNFQLPETIGGPSILYFGDVIATPVGGDHERIEAKGGPGDRFGFSDATTATLLQEMVKQHGVPDFTTAYFPENDARSHEVGPENAVDVLEQVDATLGDFFEQCGGIDQFLETVCVVITGDHAQTDVVANEEPAGIRLDKLLPSFDVADAGTPMADDEDLVICPNLRTAQIYFHTPTEERFERAARHLRDEPRIDQVLWKADFLNPEQQGYHVTTRDRGHLHFWLGSNGPNSARDAYGCTWSWQGDLRTVDGRVSEDGRIHFDSYPNAFERIAGILDLPESGHLWVTAMVGYEFGLEHTGLHAGGGSHGSLHALDSTSPLIVAGAPDGLTLPEHPRAVDVAPICLSILGIDSPHAPGASHC